MNIDRKTRISGVIKFFERLILVDWSRVSLEIRWAFETELYRKEFDAAFDAIAREDYTQAKEIHKKLALILGDSHPQVIYVGTVIYMFE